MPNLLRNQTSYLAFCTRVAAKMGKLDLAMANNNENPWAHYGTNSMGGFGFANEFVTFPYIQPDGTETGLPCGSGFATVSTDVMSPDLFTKFADAVLPRAKPFVGLPGLTGPQQMQDAFAAIGTSQAEAAAYVRMSSTLIAQHAAMALGSNATGLDIMSAVMINQGQEQRNTQWAANETMFRSVARPMTAFFESMIYAMAPFMALLVGFGSWGITMIARYCILTIWVSLWLPVMAICNLFQITMAQHGVEAMRQASATMPVTSLAATAHLQLQITNWLATGAMLAASTPAITLMLIFGGAMTATSLASRLQGGDSIDEKQVSPSAINAPPVLQASSLQERTAMDGSSTFGGANRAPQMSVGSSSAAAMTSAHMQLASASQEVSSAASVGITSAFANNRQQTMSALTSASNTGTSAQHMNADWGRSHNFNISQKNDKAWSAITAAVASGHLGAAVKMAVDAGITGGGSQQSTFTMKDAKSLQEQVSKEASTNSGFALTQANSASDTLSQLASAGSTEAHSVQSGETFSKAAKDMQKAQDQFTQTEGQTASLSQSQSLPVNTLATAAMNKGQSGYVQGLALRTGGGQAFQKAMDIVNSSPWKLDSEDGRRTQAAYMTLEGRQLPSSANLLPDSGARAKAYVEALGIGGMAAGSDASSASQARGDRNQGVAGGVRPGEATDAATKAFASAPGVQSAGQIMGDNRSTISGSRSAAQRSDVRARNNNMADPGASQGGRAATELKSSPDTFVGNTHVGQTLDRAADATQANVGETAARARATEAASARQANGGDGAGNTVQRGTANAKDLYASLISGTGVSDVAAALKFASDGDGKSAAALNWNAIQLDQHRQSFSYKSGVNGEKAVANVLDASVRSETNAAFAQREHALSTGSEANRSPALITALAVVSTIQDRGAATPEMAKAFAEASAQLNPSERGFVNSSARNGGGDAGINQSVQTSQDVLWGSDTGQFGLKKL